MRLQPASLYAHERGSVLVPLPFIPIPEGIDALGERWERKREFHVTAISTRAVAARLAQRRGVADDAVLDTAWDAIAAAVGERSVGAITLHGELRVVRAGEERTIIAMAGVEGLAELHADVAGRLEMEPGPSPAHVTLYTRPGGDGIGVHTHADLERLSSPLADPPFAWPPADTATREDNIGLALRFIAAVNARDIPPELFTPDFVMENVTTAVTDRTYRGVEGVGEWMHDFFDVLEDGRWEAGRFDAGADWAMGRLRIVGRGSVSGAPVDMPYYGVLWVRGGRICRAVGYGSRREALEAIERPVP